MERSELRPGEHRLVPKRVAGTQLQMTTAAGSWAQIRWRKAMTNLDGVLKSRDIILLTEICIVKLWCGPGKAVDLPQPHATSIHCSGHTDLRDLDSETRGGEEALGLSCPAPNKILLLWNVIP